ncbi:MAG: isocitrate lyase/PEP mutase family protein [Ectothiorhodospiraceae bacterium]|nr:isocitrate lyase/PEP mutase family protein [Chromatiales bacterium]MCP5156965.1 isocitrate lyase/PEP mutase family protein [Ectothiorhodospiraceae bacterium]
MSRTRRLRELIEAPAILVSPGVYDGYSARLVEAMGFSSASTSGAGLVNARLGVSETLGVLSMLENVDACRQLARVLSIPLMADADTGYGSAVTVFQTVQHFEEAGVSGINIEDQTFPKRCGHYAGKALVSPQEMAKKIEAAVAARRDPDFIINARTDAVAVEGIDAAVARAKLYAAAGADMIFPDAVRDEDQIKRFVDEVGIPISINIGFAIRSRPTTPLIPIPRLQTMGVARVSVPRMLPAAAIRAMRESLALLHQTMTTGEVVDRPDLLVGIDEIQALVGDDAVADLERRFLTEGELTTRYGGEPAGI